MEWWHRVIYKVAYDTVYEDVMEEERGRERVRVQQYGSAFEGLISCCPGVVVKRKGGRYLCKSVCMRYASRVKRVCNVHKKTIIKRVPGTWYAL